VYKEVGDHDGLVSMQCRFFMLMHLGIQGTDLHVRLALVLQHFQFERWIARIVEVVLNVLTGEVDQAVLKTSGTLIKYTKLLVTQCHVVHRQ